MSGTEQPAAAAGPAVPAWKRVLRRTLQVGFFFFLIKGIAWLVVGWLAWQGLT